MAAILCCSFLVIFSVLFYHPAEATPALDKTRVISAYNTASNNCKQITEFSSPLSKSAADYWCEQAFRALDLFRLNNCSGWRNPGCRRVNVDQPYQCTCMISDCDEHSIRNNVVTHFQDCAPALWIQELSSGQVLVPTTNFQQIRNGYDNTFATSNSWQTYSNAGHQTSSSSTLPSSGGAGSFGGVHGFGTAVGSSSTFTSGSNGNTNTARPSFAPRVSSSRKAGPKGTTNTPYGCDQCNGKFRSQRVLYDHKRAHHPVSSDLHCYLCNLTYYIRKSFRAHLRLKHPEVAADQKEKKNMPVGEVEFVLPFACSVCKKRYGSQHGLEDHMLSHTSDDTTCHLCNKIYSTKAIFKTHMLGQHPEVEVPDLFKRRKTREHKEGPFNCEKCGKSYTTPKGLKAHAKSHDTLETYCIPCDRTFGTKPSYEGHMLRRHPTIAQAEIAVSMEQLEEKRPVKCGICGQGCKNTESLKQHMKYHEGKTDCDECGAKFKRMSSVFVHKQKAHPKSDKSSA